MTGKEGGCPLQHVVPGHVLWGGPNRHIALIHNQPHLQTLTHHKAEATPRRACLAGSRHADRRLAMMDRRASQGCTVRQGVQGCR